MGAEPNLFIVGAAKAGTTAMHAYVSQHPQVFMSEVKEPGWFASDLGLRTPWSDDLDAYLSLFAAGSGCPVRGESTPAYLLSREAAARIRAFAPGARILILLRNPLEAIRSVFAEARKFGIEPQRRFETALARSDAGRPELEGRPGGCWLRYREVVRYADQVARYLDAFPREQVFVALYDDLVRDTPALCRQVFGFLGVDPDVPLEVGRVNEQHAFRSATLQRLYMRPYARGMSAAAPRRFGRAWGAVVRWNSLPAERATLSPAVRADLLADLGPDVERLAGLIGRDLSRWLAPPG